MIIYPDFIGFGIHLEGIPFDIIRRAENDVHHTSIRIPTFSINTEILGGELDTRIIFIHQLVHFRAGSRIHGLPVFQEQPPFLLPFRIFDFLAVSPPPEKRIRKVLVRPANVQKKGRYPPYREWPSEEKALLRAQVVLAEKYGYDMG